jgi:CBS domain-containing protein
MASPPDALLTALPGCARLGPDALRALASAARSDSLPTGARLIGEGEPVPDWYCLVEGGAIQVSRVDLEADEILDYLTAGDVLDPGMPGLPAAWSASTVEPTRCFFVPQSLVAQYRVSPPSPPAVARPDLELFVRRVSELVKGLPVTSAAAASVTDAAGLMTRRRVGSVIVVADDGAPIGIVTDRDLRTKVVARGLPSTTTVGSIMSSPLISIEPGRLAFDALLEMTRRRVHHLAVVADGRLQGVISSRDIMLLQGAHPVAMARDIDTAGSLDGLETIAPRVQSVVKWLAGESAGVFDIGRIVAELNDRLVCRALELVVTDLEARGQGRPPVPYAWLAGGSEGRREQTLKTDQDNGLVYEDPPVELQSAAAGYFAVLGEAMADTLSRLGFPRCDGDFMASNPRWRQPESVWRGYFQRWMEIPKPDVLLSASIFFDLRAVGGDQTLGRRLWDWVCEQAPTQTLFLRHMAKVALERQVPLGLFGGFVVERSGAHKDALDLKARGVFPMIQAMRVHALSLGLPDTNTVDRLGGAAARGRFTATEASELRDAYEVIARLRLRRQLACLDAGVAPDNFIEPDGLGKADRLLLKEAFKTLHWLQRGIEDRFQTEEIG